MTKQINERIEGRIERIKQALIEHGRLAPQPFSLCDFEDLVDEAMDRIRADWEAKTGFPRRAKMLALGPKEPTPCDRCGGEVHHIPGYWSTDDDAGMYTLSTCKGCGCLWARNALPDDRQPILLYSPSWAARPDHCR